MIEIQLAKQQDSAEILELQKICYRIEAAIYNDYSIQPLMQTKEELAQEFNFSTVLKAVTGQRIIGSVRAYIRDATGYIGKLIVHPEFQNQGIGTLLMNEIEKRLGQVKRFVLFTGSKSTKNLQLYQKLGYKSFKNERINENVTLVFLEKIVSVNR